MGRSVRGGEPRGETVEIERFRCNTSARRSEATFLRGNSHCHMCHFRGYFMRILANIFDILQQKFTK